MRCIIIVVSINVLILSQLAAQSVEVLDYEYKNDGKLYTSYKIISKARSSYSVKVFYELNGTSVPMRFVTGDVGPFILSDTINQFVWDVDKELKFFDGNTRFNFDLDPMIPEAKVKRGKTNYLTMNLPDSFRIKEFRLTDEKLRAENSLLEFQHHDKHLMNVEMTIGIKHKVGSYQVMAITTEGREIYSEPVRIKPKVSNFWKVFPVAVGAGVAGVLILQETTKPPPDLSSPPPFPEF